MTMANQILNTSRSVKPGISSYTYTWAIGVPGSVPQNPMGIYQLIEATAGFGLTVLQVADNLPLDKFNSQELIRVKNFATGLGVQIEVGARGMSRENLTTYIELARFFQSPVLRFVIDGPGFEPSLEDIHQIVANALPTLESAKITLAIENHDRLLAREFVEIVQTANSPFVGICLDTVNSMGAGEGLETVIGLLAPLTVNLHVKEFSIRRISHKMGFIVEGLPLGQGILPVRSLIEKVSPRCQSAILEQWTPPESTVEATVLKESQWAEQSISYLKSVIS